MAQAERGLLIARQLRPTDPGVWLRTAHFYTAAARQLDGDTHGLADGAFRQATQLAPNQATIYAAWGRASLENGHPDRAASLLRHAVGLDASNGAAYVDLGAAELALGRLDTALADYREAARLLPESGQAYAGMAAAYWRLGRRHEALLAVEKALRRDPHNMQAHHVRREIDRSPSSAVGK
jgi:tetratricopeptide (TPR) repeat protein